MGGQPCCRQGGCAEDDLSPAGDGGEGGGALHGVANEAEVGGGVRGQSRDRRGAVGAAKTAMVRVGHSRIE